MRNRHALVGLFAAGLLGFAAPAQAQIQFQGSTKGCFYGAGESGCTPSSSSTLLYLSFLSSTFDVTSADGWAGIGAAAGTPNVNNLGSFAVTGNIAAYNGSHFLLDVVFTLPTITSSPSVFSAAVRGSVRALASGFVGISFDPSSQIFDFTSGSDQGTFVLNVNDVSLTPGASAMALSGDIEVSSHQLTTTPEPASMALMATGLAGLTGFVRRRRKRA